MLMKRCLETFSYGATTFTQDGYGISTNTRAYNLKSHDDRVELTAALNSYRDSQRELHVSARKRDRESLVKQMVEIAAKIGVIDEYAVLERHVKAHSGTGTARQWVNNWCDKMAKQGALL